MNESPNVLLRISDFKKERLKISWLREISMAVLELGFICTLVVALVLQNYYVFLASLLIFFLHSVSIPNVQILGPKTLRNSLNQAEMQIKSLRNLQANQGTVVVRCSKKSKFKLPKNCPEKVIALQLLGDFSSKLPEGGFRKLIKNPFFLRMRVQYSCSESLNALIGKKTKELQEEMVQLYRLDLKDLKISVKHRLKNMKKLILVLPEHSEFSIFFFSRFGFYIFAFFFVSFFYRLIYSSFTKRLNYTFLFEAMENLNLQTTPNSILRRGSRNEIQGSTSGPENNNMIEINEVSLILNEISETPEN